MTSLSPRRPFRIAELADRATHNLWDPSKGLKQWLKAADDFRKAGRVYYEAGDLEAAFVEFAKAATIILEKLPTHKEYFTLLTATQRHNLGLNGQDILVYLRDIKPVLVDRYEHWAIQHPEEAAAVRAALDVGIRMQVDSRPDQYDESDWQAHKAARREEQLRREDARHTSDALYKAVEQKTAGQARHPQIDTAPRRKKEDTLSPARRLTDVSREPSLIRQDRLDRSGSKSVTLVSGKERGRQRERGRKRDDTRRYQEEAERHGEEGVVQRWNREQEGILQHQQEAEAASRAARRGATPSPVYMPAPSAHTYQHAQPSPRNDESVYEDILPPSVPLEISTRHQTASVKGPSYPIPITTTSSPPPGGHVRYPQLMSQHQLSQGYAPSLQSMFSYPTLKPSEVGHSSLLFIPDASKTPSTHLYPADALLLRPSTPAPVSQPGPPVSQFTATFSTLSQTQGPPPPLKKHAETLHLCSPDRKNLKEALKLGGATDLDITTVLKQKIEQVDFYPIPTRPLVDLVDGCGNEAFNINNIEPYFGHVRLDTSPEGVLGVGSFKTAQAGQLTLFPPAHSGLGSRAQHNIVLKCPYINNFKAHGCRPPFMRYQIGEELEKVFREANVLYWAKALLTMTYNFIDRAIERAKGSPPFEIPRLRFVDAGLVVAYSQRPNTPSNTRAPNAGTVTTAYLAEEVIDCPGDEFIKFIHNGGPDPLPKPGELGYEVAEFLAFTQHVQYHKTGGQVYISDYQGSMTLLTDPQILTHPEVGEGESLFSDGNLEIGVKLFEKEHVCNKYCKWPGFHLERYFVGEK